MTSPNDTSRRSFVPRSPTERASSLALRTAADLLTTAHARTVTLDPWLNAPLAGHRLAESRERLPHEGEPVAWHDEALAEAALLGAVACYTRFLRDCGHDARQILAAVADDVRAGVQAQREREHEPATVQSRADLARMVHEAGVWSVAVYLTPGAEPGYP